MPRGAQRRRLHLCPRKSKERTVNLLRPDLRGRGSNVCEITCLPGISPREVAADRYMEERLMFFPDEGRSPRGAHPAAIRSRLLM